MSTNADTPTCVNLEERLLQFNDVVPPSFRALDPSIPSDQEIAQRIDALLILPAP